jgi:NTP pyrophosphatase (non-canonical NTP hydrolase)
VATEFDRIWEDQAAFNRQFRPDPQTFEDKSELTSEMVLATTDELHELLRTVKWKKHRRPRRYEPNLAHTTEELVDVFKDFITLCQTWGVTPDALVEGYWAKTAVNRQRYSEEWVKHHIDRPVILLDLDNVLCDYISGFGRWLLHELDRLQLPPAVTLRIETLVANREWLDAEACGLDKPFYEGLKHRFRTTGEKRHLRAMPDAYRFVQWCSARAMIVLLTARPIDRYPNMLTDTVQWLAINHMLSYIDHIWWGADKGRVVEVEEIREHVVFAVDDIQKHCEEYEAKGVRSYWIQNEMPSPVWHNGTRLVQPVNTLDEIMQREG